jgi:ABC-2 type transport system permease protein
MNIMAAFRKEMMEQWRTRRALVVAAVLVLFGLLSPVAAKFLPEIMKSVAGAEQFAGLIPPPTVKDAVAQYIKNIAQFALFIGILVTMAGVAQEKERGTAAMMLVKPLPRWAFILSKFVSSLVVFAVSLILAGLGAYYYTLYLFEPLPLLPWIEMNGLLLVYTMMYVALTLLFSTINRSQALAGGLALTSLAVLGILGSFPALIPYLPAHLVVWSSDLMNGSAASAWPALWVCLGIILASLLGSWLILRRQEL